VIAREERALREKVRGEEVWDWECGIGSV